GVEPFDPPPLPLRIIHLAIVQPAGPPRPEFDPLGYHPEAGPERRTRNRLVRVLALQFGDALLQLRPLLQRMTLPRSPVADLTGTWTAGEFGIRRLRRDRDDGTFDRPLCLHGRPVEAERRSW